MGAEVFVGIKPINAPYDQTTMDTLFQNFLMLSEQDQEIFLTEMKGLKGLKKTGKGKKKTNGENHTGSYKDESILLTMYFGEPDY